MQRRQSAIRVGLPKILELDQGMAQGTGGVHMASRANQRRRQSCGWEPARRRSNQDGRLHLRTNLSSSLSAASGYKVVPPSTWNSFSRSSGNRWNVTLAWLNCRVPRRWRRASLTRVITVVTIEAPSSAVISVNSTPTTLSFWYQPVTSVSRVASLSADNMMSSGSPFFSTGNGDSMAISISRQERWERSARLRSCQTTRRNSCSARALRSATEVRGMDTFFGFELLLERRAFMFPSAVAPVQRPQLIDLTGCRWGDEEPDGIRRLFYDRLPACARA